MTEKQTVIDPWIGDIHNEDTKNFWSHNKKERERQLAEC